MDKTSKPLFENDGKESLTIEGIEVYVLCLKDQRERLDVEIKRYEEAARIRREFT